jgi:hypothetical protein
MNQESGIDKIEQRLYSKHSSRWTTRNRRRLSRHDKTSMDQWAHKTSDTQAQKMSRSSPLITWFLVLSILFFVIASGIAVISFLGGLNTVSTENVAISLFGPVVAPAGEEISMQISITNNNSISLQGADLLVEFPKGARAVGNRTEILSRYREEIGEVRAGQTIQRLIRFIPFAEIDSTQELSAGIEYKMEQSSALFFKNQQYIFRIGASPLRLVVDAVREINAGQELEMELAITSNSTEVLEGVVLKSEYPFGFAFTSSAPLPLTEQNVWELGDLAPDATRKILIRGIVDGQEEDERIFMFSVGLSEVGNSTKITPLVSVLQSVVVRRPFLSLSLAVNGDELPVHAVNSGSGVSVDIGWQNTLPSALIDAEIQAQITGPGWERSGVRTSNGFFRSLDNTVIWNQQTTRELSVLEAGKSGRLGFIFPILDRNNKDLLSLRNPEILIEVSARGRRVSESGVPEELHSVAKVILKISTDPILTARTLHFSGPIQNIGPIPPRVDQETTYTIVWSFTNTTNEIKDMEIFTTLPSNVRFVGVIDPTNEDLIHSPVGGRVVWSISRLPAGLGIALPTREVAFQVALTPGLTQAGQSPTITNPTAYEGVDSFSGALKSGGAPILNTRFNSEAQYKRDDEIVLK